MVPKAGKPGKFHLVQNLSYPHVPRGPTTSMNSAIDSDLYPSTWGTFSTICTLIWHLPPGTQGAVHNISEAYRSIPVALNQWPGLVVQLDNDSFTVDTNACFGCTSSSGSYGSIGDAGADLLQAHGIGPVSKWVDDHVFFQILQDFIQSYNGQHAAQHHHITANGGRFWYWGQTLADSHAKEFDEDCASPIKDL